MPCFTCRLRKKKCSRDHGSPMQSCKECLAGGIECPHKPCSECCALGVDCMRNKPKGWTKAMDDDYRRQLRAFTTATRSNKKSVSRALFKTFIYVLSGPPDCIRIAAASVGENSDHSTHSPSTSLQASKSRKHPHGRPSQRVRRPIHRAGHPHPASILAPPGLPYSFINMTATHVVSVNQNNHQMQLDNELLRSDDNAYSMINSHSFLHPYTNAYPLASHSLEPPQPFSPFSRHDTDNIYASAPAFRMTAPLLPNTPQHGNPAQNFPIHLGLGFQFLPFDDTQLRENWPTNPVVHHQHAPNVGPHQPTSSARLYSGSHSSALHESLPPDSTYITHAQHDAEDHVNNHSNHATDSAVSWDSATPSVHTSPLPVSSLYGSPDQTGLSVNNPSGHDAIESSFNWHDWLALSSTLFHTLHESFPPSDHAFEKHA